MGLTAEVIISIELFVLSSLSQVNFLDLLGVLVLNSCFKGGIFDSHTLADMEFEKL